MFRNLLSFGGTLLLAGAVMFATPALSWAQRGGRIGGAHFGGARIGGASFGRGYYGGARIGGYRGGLYGYGYRGYRGYYGAYFPGYGGYYYPDYGGAYYPYGDWGVGYGAGYGDNYYDPTTTDGNSYVSPVPPPIQYEPSYANAVVAPDTTAHLTVKVPADAGVYIGGVKMNTPGTVREFTSPPLTPGSQYTYQIAARWIDNGRLVTQKREVQVTAGQHVDVDFSVAGTNAAALSPAKQ